MVQDKEATEEEGRENTWGKLGHRDSKLGSGERTCLMGRGEAEWLCSNLCAHCSVCRFEGQVDARAQEGSEVMVAT